MANVKKTETTKKAVKPVKTEEEIIETNMMEETPVIDENIEESVIEKLENIDVKAEFEKAVESNDNEENKTDTEKIESIVEVAKEFEEEKKQFNENIEKCGQDTKKLEETIQKEIENAQKLLSRVNNGAFTNFWNGSSFNY